MTENSFWKTFRFIFVLFFLYLIGDAFHRWDGFKYYASSSEFLLSFALAVVFVCVLTAIVAVLLWTPYIILKQIINRIGWHKQKDLLYLFTTVCLLISIMAWTGKRMIFPLLSTTAQVKTAVLISVLGTSAFAAWLLRGKARWWTEQAGQLMDILQNRITPLVWIFSALVCVSVPVVTYQTWFSGPERKVSAKVTARQVPEENKPNIIFVTFDALSARNMSLYGYERPTTPFISKWSETATVFTRAEAESNYTAPTTSSLMTGKRVWSHLRFSRMRGSPPIKTDTESLPVLLKKNGYYNMAFMVNMISELGNLGVKEYFDIAPFPTEFMVARNFVSRIHKTLTPLFYGKFKIHNWLFQEGFITEKLFARYEKDFGVTSYPPEIAFNRLIAAIDQGEKPFFAWVHLNPPHGPYLAPEPYKGMFDSSGSMRTIKTQLNERNNLLEYRARHSRFPDELEILKARYDEFVLYCDEQFGQFIRQMEEKGMSENTIIILSTDHGEIFDHNNILHGRTLYEPETHIPLIIKMPGQSEGSRIDDIVEQVDITATMLEIAGIDIPSWMEGRSLMPLMRGEPLEPRPAFAMNLEQSSSRQQQITKGTIVVWEEDYKLIHYLGEKRSELYNLKKDPGELENLVDAEQDLVRHLLSLIHDNLRKANEKIGEVD